jgi:hypothetical protein
MTFEQKMAHLRPHAPTLVSLLTALFDRPDVDQLDDWIYCCSGSYTVLGTLLSEMHPAYDGLVLSANIGVTVSDGHNAFEEFVITVFDAIARYNSAFDGHKYDIDQLADALFMNIMCERAPDEYECRDEPATDDTGGGRY